MFTYEDSNNLENSGSESESSSGSVRQENENSKNRRANLTPEENEARNKNPSSDRYAERVTTKKR